MYIPRRFVVVVLCFLAIFFIFFVRVNLSVTILKLEDEYGWDSSIQGNVLSSFFWGYIVLQIPSGILAARYGGGPLLFVGMLIPAVFTLLSALVGKWPVVLIIFQVIVGLGAALTFPAIYSLFSYWTPTDERSVTIGFVWTGVSLGNALGTLLAGYIAEHQGWRAVFYIFGGLNLLWCVLWLLFGSSSPDTYRSISIEERAYIRDHLPQPAVTHISNEEQQNQIEMKPIDVPADNISRDNQPMDGAANVVLTAENDNRRSSGVNEEVNRSSSGNIRQSEGQYDPYERRSSLAMDTVAVIPIHDESIFDQLRQFPWRAGLTNLIVYAPYLAHFSNNWIIYTITSLLPKYIKFKLDLSVQKSGEFSFYPYLCHGIMNFSSGYICGYFIKNGYNPTTVRKSAHFISTLCSILFIIICINLSSKSSFLVFMSLGLASVASLSSAFTPNFLDISPRYGSFLISLSNTLATVPGIVSPIMATAILGDDQTNGGWMIVFYLGCGILLLSDIYFIIFAKGTPIDALN